MSVMSSGRNGGTPAFPSELTGMVPRDVRFTSAGIAVVAIVCLLVLGALVSAILLSIDVARARHPRERASTLAQTVAVEVRRGEHPRRGVSYRFEVDGRAFAGRATLRERDRRDLFEGGTIQVEYIRSDPSMNWVTGYEPRPVPAWAVPLVAGVLIALAGAIAWHLRRDWVLMSEGRGVQGRVIGQKKVHRDKHTAYQITCSFQDFSGATRTMHYDVAKAPPAAGTPITIVYHRDNPRWNRVYPLKFVRPARARTAWQAADLSASRSA
jgi:hypothetical protein